MQIDLYTKSILTVIAISLLTIALQNFIPVANADKTKIQRVAICDLLNGRCAVVGEAIQYGGNPANVLLTQNYGG